MRLRLEVIASEWALVPDLEEKVKCDEKKLIRLGRAREA